MRKCVFLLLSSLFLFGCTSTKKTIDPQKIQALKDIVEEKAFETTFDAANPVAFTNTRGIEKLLPPGSNLARISLINNPNYFRVKNDSIKMYLPYYGEQQMGGAYQSESGLTFEGKPDYVRKEFNKKKNNYTITYRLKAKDESLTANLTLFANKSSTLRINSSIRTTIIYYGNWAATEILEE